MSTTFPIRLGSIPKQAKLSILLELVIPEISRSENRFVIATGDMSFVLPFDPIHPYKTPIFLSRLTSSEANAEPPPKSIFQALSQITLFRMQERARQEVAEGKVQDASLRLQRLATQLLSMGEIELAQTAIIEAERIQQTHMLSAEGEKRIKVWYTFLPAASPCPGVNESNDHMPELPASMKCWGQCSVVNAALN